MDLAERLNDSLQIISKREVSAAEPGTDSQEFLAQIYGVQVIIDEMTI